MINEENSLQQQESNIRHCGKLTKRPFIHVFYGPFKILDEAFYQTETESSTGVVSMIPILVSRHSHQKLKDLYDGNKERSSTYSSK